MDRKIEKKRWTRKRIVTLIVSVLIIILSAFTIRSFNQKSYKINGDKLSIKTAKKGDFQDIILIDGVVESKKMILVNTLVGGSVSKVYVEDGVLVKEGQALMQLDNPTVMMNYMNQETAIIEQINNLRNLKLALEKDQRVLNESLIDSEYQLNEKGRLFKVDSQLYAKRVISDNEYKDILESYKYRNKKYEFLVRNVERTEKDNNVQIKQINNSIMLMERNLKHIRENMEKMLVKAPVSGQLSSFDPTIGESYSANQTIAKIDVMQGFKVEAQVDEYYLSTVKPGLNAQFVFNGQPVDLIVNKVIPEVINGMFKIELYFGEETPTSMTTGLNAQIRLELSDTRSAVLIPRGNYIQSSGGRYVFVIGEDGNAMKTPIRLGKNNPTHYEVLEGLNGGERIVTSSYELYKDFELLEIK